jgi:EAL domain-containing protein (putative c-di-GMP-specific phosphodiesterase class I)
LSLLKHFPLSQLKIDRLFVNNLCLDTKDAIVTLAKAFGLSVVAEGIESEEQEFALKALGCASGQGYLYARPMPAEQVLMTLAKQTDTWAPGPPIDVTTLMAE